MKIIGIDIGGANTKVASSDGKFVDLHYVPLWKETSLPEVLRTIAETQKPDRIAVVMTGELADCYEDKEAGVKGIVDAVENNFDGDIQYMGVSGNFSREVPNPRDLAAANWVASAKLIGKEVGDAIFVDMGSTTCDIIPIKKGKPVAHTTDTERLANGELLYEGILRTNAAAVLDRVDISIGSCRVSSELFATTADAYLVLGNIEEKTYTAETADGEGKSIEEASRRLARVVCADLKDISSEDVEQIALAIKEKQIQEIQNGIREVARHHHLDTVVCAGLGEFLIAEACELMERECFSIAQRWGKEISKVFPAYAVAKLLEMELEAE
ncbi:putative H4MPT-linked C1 transfer pathway protein [Methanohalophilus levihalophilus]|uniref:hydantoinase/oxoprolinase family protein n=1 Tax=Methanohalophilus levihalophilus TaxID=1431282 RepID=UPI001AE77790|nr:hydantoinase/oxoprolinase family protein [Methanohalophilus levihalophilus]MBP2030956.1 putative H4MPT-linked C1 transfer pathway protein [Methanohalophilus levihalophilus]